MAHRIDEGGQAMEELRRACGWMRDALRESNDQQRFMLWLVPTVERFPRSQKFLLSDRLQTTALDVLEALIEAT